MLMMNETCVMSEITTAKDSTYARRRHFGVA